MKAQKLLQLLLALTVVAGLAGCASGSGEMTLIHKGMTKAEVIAVLGPPKSVLAKDGKEYLRYDTPDPMHRSEYDLLTPYEICLVGGKVVSYNEFFESGVSHDSHVSDEYFESGHVP